MQITPTLCSGLAANPHKLKLQTQYNSNTVPASSDQFVKRATKPQPQFAGQAGSSLTGKTKVMKWAENGDVANLREALANDEHAFDSLDRKDIFGENAVMKAVANNHRTCALLLAKWGGETILDKDDDGKSALDRTTDSKFKAELLKICKMDWEDRMKLDI